jgi:hypothetical protein
MSLFSGASLVLIPSGYKESKLYSVKPMNGDGDLIWTRNSTAYRLQENNILGQVNLNVPRLNHISGYCPTCLMESSRQNLVLWSEDFDNVYWQKAQTNIITGQTIAPDGNQTADLLTNNSTSAVLRTITNLNTISFTNGITYIVSIFAKKKDLDYVFIRFSNVGSVFTNSVAIFDIVNGATTFVDSGVTARIENYGNGWYRCFATRTAAATSGGTINFVGITNSPIATNLSGMTIGLGNYIWGAQLEAGSSGSSNTFGTTYIPTQSTTNFRSGDTFSCSNVYTKGLVSFSGGTWFVNLKNNIYLGRDGTLPSLTIGNQLNTFGIDSLYIRNNGGGLLSIGKSNGGTNTVGIYNLPSGDVKTILRWNGSIADIFVNGIKVLSGGTSFTATTSLQTLGGLPQVPIFIQEMALYNQVMSDEFCQAITTDNFNTYSAMSEYYQYKLI